MANFALLILLLLIIAIPHSLSAPPAPAFPSSFSAQITITSNLLPADIVYPPRVKIVRLLYSLELQKAKIVIEKGHDEGKMYVRDYGGEMDYELSAGSCRRAFLGEEMTPPTLPLSVHLGDAQISEGGTMTNYEHFVRSTVYSNIHIYSDPGNGYPRRLVVEDIDDDGVTEVSMTYDIDSLQELTGSEDWTIGEGHTEGIEGSCERFVGGFPYMHLFHYYLRF
ncbi:hypothetical protein TrVE_jg6250 [Triparma verrucosa]|uniref:Uncharacterized protein n=1 Tax=Triparma verrucosa TaxID=1606542 RepID=A0A9W7ET46_9STRA|nr:hypothetical protein TrVE_jg6250 [Triparma verrucosa]